MMDMHEPAQKNTSGCDIAENNVCVGTSSKMGCSYIRKTYEKLKQLQKKIMAIYQPTEKTTVIYVIIPKDVNEVNTPTTSEVDFTHMRLRSGVLKLLQQICILTIATIAFFWYFKEPTIDYCFYNYTDAPSHAKSYYYYICVTNIVILLCTSVLLFIWLPVVHVFMWVIILHKVEKSTSNYWYAIEYTICILGAIICSIASAFLFIGSFVTFSMFTLVLALLFIFDICLIRHKQKLNLSFQSEEPGI
ncbi:uncharacterized protein LOC117181551 isoform X3 [Belonocnema kinseyi]|uniref:uncharacterized protein LOC117181551 isoform X3 n=1 Tax=Belonocnema kinseyi TaxID=2817044 RepID=UPI00143CC8C8|nr:uncharacterized protein LOC117181551 isoform X3 [Belonocnema kinseyi]